MLYWNRGDLMTVECQYLWCRYNRAFRCVRKNIVLDPKGLCSSAERAVGEEIDALVDGMMKRAGIKIIEYDRENPAAAEKRKRQKKTDPNKTGSRKNVMRKRPKE